MIGQAPTLQVGNVHKIGRSAAHSAPRDSGADEFSKLLRQERDDNVQLLEDTSLPAADTDGPEGPIDTEVKPLENEGQNAIHLIEVLLSASLIETPAKGKHVTREETVVSGFERKQVAVPMDRTSRITQGMIHGSTRLGHDRVSQPLPPRLELKQSADDSASLRSGQASDPPKALIVGVVESDELVSASQERHDVRSSLPLHGMDNVEEGKFEPGSSRLEERANAEQMVPVLYPAPSVHSLATSTPARQIMSQLRDPLAAVVRESANVAESFPMRQLKISLSPDDLGTVSVTLKIHNGKLSVTIEASTSATADLLQRDMSLLEDLLRPVMAYRTSATITIHSTEPGNGSGTGNTSDSESGSAFSSSESAEGHSQSPTGKEAASTQEQERTPAHEDLSPVQRNQLGILVL